MGDDPAQTWCGREGGAGPGQQPAARAPGSEPGVAAPQPCRLGELLPALAGDAPKWAL